MDFFQYDFLTRALVAGTLLGFLSPLIGLFLVVRRYSLLADTLSHVSLFGLAIAALLKFPLFLGAFIASLVGGLGMEAIRRSGRVMNEAVLALFLSGSLASALLILALAQGVNVNLLSYLFGSIVTVTLVDVLILVGLLFSVLVFFLFFYRAFFLIALDEDLARTSGVHLTLLNTLFILLASAVVASGIRIVGALLVGALMVVPALAAMQWRLSFQRTLFMSILFAELSVIPGFLLAYRLDLPSGATIVLLAIAWFLLSTLLARPFSTHFRLFQATK